MLSNIVILYMAYQIGLPTWCKVLVAMELVLNVMQFLIGFAEGYNE